MQREKIILLETTVDHITGEEIGNALLELNAAPNILDAIYIPACGKKNRPCGLVQAICRPEGEEDAVRLVFRHTHALGIRRQELERYVLPRHGETATLQGRQVAVKVHDLEGESYARVEAEHLAALAKAGDVGMPALRFKKC